MFTALAAIVVLSGSASSTEKPKTYPQLISIVKENPSVKDTSLLAQKSFSFVNSDRLPSGAKVLSAAKAASGVVWIVTDKGSFKSKGGAYIPLIEPTLLKTHQEQVNPDTVVLCVTSDKDGHIWAGTTSGVYITDGDQWWQHLDRSDGVPYEIVRCILALPNGDLWAGTPQGAWRLRNGDFRYFWGKRWMPGNSVTAIAETPAHEIIMQTDQGIATIAEKQITLAEKAAHFNEITQARHNRRGFICETHLKERGKPEKGFTWEVSDNDGLWTSMYVGAMCFKYAATKDPQARKQAWESMNAMLELERLTGVSGFPARAVVTDEELKAGASGFSADETVRVPGETDKIWFRSPVEKNVWCKGDTSSDELDGHYFAWQVYYDLVANNEEKQKIAGTVRRVTDNIIKGGYNLIGHTGRKTRWGVFNPDLLNSSPLYWDQRPLNSMELLMYFKVASHITGDRKYEQAYEDIIKKDHFLLNMLLIRRGVFGKWWAINHSDDEMLFLQYYSLLMLENDPDRRRIMNQSIARSWEDSPIDQTIKVERSPLYNFIYGATTGKPCNVEDAVSDLQDWPWDMVQWDCSNRQRHDVNIKTAQGINRFEYDRVLPVSERRLMRWNGNPFEADGGSDGMLEDDGAAWAVAYWMGVYHGYIPK